MNININRQKRKTFFHNVFFIILILCFYVCENSAFASSILVPWQCKKDDMEPFTASADAKYLISLHNMPGVGLNVYFTAINQNCGNDHSIHRINSIKVNGVLVKMGGRCANNLLDFTPLTNKGQNLVIGYLLKGKELNMNDAFNNQLAVFTANGFKGCYTKTLDRLQSGI
ncbi:hypothetical protein [Carnimonas bestiolae]|uniref:hypothetical protein n=1 Tax=Carnimonas bestiolae TaxID=3402172 RepID=UPI003EDB999A